MRLRGNLPSESFDLPLDCAALEYPALPNVKSSSGAERDALATLNADNKAALLTARDGQSHRKQQNRALMARHNKVRVCVCCCLIV